MQSPHLSDPTSDTMNAASLRGRVAAQDVDNQGYSTTLSLDGRGHMHCLVDTFALRRVHAPFGFSPRREQACRSQSLSLSLFPPDDLGRGAKDRSNARYLYVDSLQDKHN